MDTNTVHEIAALLQRAAKQKKLVTYQRLHSLFVPGQTLTERYRALQDAAQLLSDCRSLDYGCLMALDSGLPGDDFFARFRRNRPAEFQAVMGFASPGRSRTKKRRIAEQERARVYEHAKKYAGNYALSERAAVFRPQEAYETY
ncbi:hypothetical protein AWB77_00492 [Caballeronia fortuita]|uniref:Uncharacterized protein n=1 Tax=Caballeronia fortuita TaxID=1777138 RepID=A0A157ZCZ0_9BURK|nr:hypothetical protein [Caballeronia fortuita]SAK42757.1 hypothetical protein AWB77_00492 [Caballeronia fortuita]